MIFETVVKGVERFGDGRLVDTELVFFTEADSDEQAIAKISSNMRVRTMHAVREVSTTVM